MEQLTARRKLEVSLSFDTSFILVTVAIYPVSRWIGAHMRSSIWQRGTLESELVFYRFIHGLSSVNNRQNATACTGQTETIESSIGIVAARALYEMQVECILIVNLLQSSLHLSELISID